MLTISPFLVIDDNTNINKNERARKIKQDKHKQTRKRTKELKGSNKIHRYVSNHSNPCASYIGSYLVSQQSPKGFASYIGFVYNMHRPLYIPLSRWTKPRNFASYSTKKLENVQASGNPRRYSCDPHSFRQNPNPSIPRDLS